MTGSWVAAYDRRLRTLELVAGAGTSISEGGRCKVLFSGRLQRARAIEGPRHEAASDADVVRDAYLNGGHAALQDLRGSFALLLHDIGRDRFIAARDALGYHPLFFAEQGDRIMLAASPDQLLACGVPNDVDRAVAAGWICHRPLDGQETLFVEIRRLLPGHCLRVSGSGLSVQRYWDPSRVQSSAALDFDLVHERFDGILRLAVARCLDLGPAGIYLSGGVDSTAIAAIAAEVSRERGLPAPLALSLRFPDAESDESAAQRTVAIALGLPQVLVSFDEAFGTEGGLVTTLGMAGDLTMPPSTPWHGAWDHLALQAVERGCAVILTGEWGEWLRTQRELAADLLRRLDLATLYTLLESERRYYGSSRWRSARTLFWRSGLRVLMRQGAAAALVRAGGHSMLDGSRRRRLLHSLPSWIAPDLSLRREFAQRWVATLAEPGWGAFHHRALAGFLDSADAIAWMDDYPDHGRRLGIELWEPFHDRDLIEFVFSTPPKYLFHGARVKALPEASVRARIPGLPPTALGLAWPDRAYESMLVHEGAAGLGVLDGLPVLSDLKIVAADPVLKAVTSGDFSQEVGYQAAWRSLALEAWLQARVRSDDPRELLDKGSSAG